MAFFFGNFGDNQMDGTAGNDLMFGLWGDDEMNGGAGNDMMFGGRGDDTMDGGEGCDILLGGSGKDVVVGGLGNDWVFGGRGNDVLYGDTTGDTTTGDFNYVVNGSFEDTTGLTPTSFGFVGDIPGWTNTGTGTPEVVNSGVVGMPSSDGDYWIDSGTLANRNIDISQDIQGLTDGETYMLSFDAGQWDTPSPAPDESMNVYWNGELIATVRPETIDAYENFEFEITSGSGDGTDTLRFEGLTNGESDAQGVAFDNVQITDIIEEGGDDILKGGSGDDEMYGGGGDDILKGGRGDDINSGGAGADCFIFGKCDGTDTIIDFEIGIDTIALYGSSRWYSHGEDTSFEDLAITQNGDDTEIEFGHTLIILEDISADSLTADHFYIA